MIRLASVAPLFRTGGMDLGRSWTAHESLTTEQRNTLRDRHGRWIKVHPNDRDKLAALGLRMQTDDAGHPQNDRPLVEITAADATKPVKGATPKKGT